MIKIGDLVMVLRPSICCGNSRGTGVIFTAADINHGEFTCGACGATEEIFYVSKDKGSRYSTQMHRLIKIDPLNEDEVIREEEVAI